jgi:hypothetical protein
MRFKYYINNVYYGTTESSISTDGMVMIRIPEETVFPNTIKFIGWVAIDLVEVKEE